MSLALYCTEHLNKTPIFLTIVQLDNRTHEPHVIYESFIIDTMRTSTLNLKKNKGGRKGGEREKKEREKVKRKEKETGKERKEKDVGRMS